MSSRNVCVTERKVDPSMIEDPSVAVLDVLKRSHKSRKDRGLQLNPSGRPLLSQNVMDPHQRSPVGHLLMITF